MPGSKTILICRCAERGLLSGAEQVMADNPSAMVIDDLCKAAAERDKRLAEGAASEHLTAYACHPRAVKALFAFAGAPLPESAVLINLRKPDGTPTEKPSMASNPAWYPVIDAERCSQCGQCVEFCLFGVYEKTANGNISVANPTSCKNNCPACARICPEAAIIFPKVSETPINGAEISDEATVKANIKINVDEILGDDVYAALNERKQKRRSLLNQKKVEKALEERQRCAKGTQP